MRITIFGAGNGGQAMAGHFTLLGHEVILFNRKLEEIKELSTSGTIHLSGAINGIAKPHKITCNIAQAVQNAELIMITTTADAHVSVAIAIAPFVKNNQIIVLNPGRTLGALVFSKAIAENTTARPLIAEAQSLLYACRASEPGHVKVLGVKKNVPISAFPSINTNKVFEVLKSITPGFIKVNSILETGLENIGAILHPAIVLFNAAAIERGTSFYFYRDMTSNVAQQLMNIDNERIQVAKAYGLQVKPLLEWITYAYDNHKGDNIHERMQTNPAYHNIISPTDIYSRYITEDIPTGLIPITELAKVAGVNTPYMNSIITLCSGLVNRDFYTTGRTLKNLGIESPTIEKIKQLV